MKLPNGYGSAVKLSGKRRKPYQVRKTVGWHYDEEKDTQVQDMITVGYTATRAEGLQIIPALFCYSGILSGYMTASSLRIFPSSGSGLSIFSRSQMLPDTGLLITPANSETRSSGGLDGGRRN